MQALTQRSIALAMLTAIGIAAAPVEGQPQREQHRERDGTRWTQAPDDADIVERLESLRADQPRRGEGPAYLGIRLAEPTQEVRAVLGLEDRPVVLVEEVIDDSPAQRADLEVYDIILEADGRGPIGVDELRAIMAGKSPGDPLELVVLRGGDEEVIEIESLASAARPGMRPRGDRRGRGERGPRLRFDQDGQAFAEFAVDQTAEDVLGLLESRGADLDEGTVDEIYEILEDMADDLIEVIEERGRANRELGGFGRALRDDAFDDIEDELGDEGLRLTRETERDLRDLLQELEEGLRAELGDRRQQRLRLFGPGGELVLPDDLSEMIDPRVRRFMNPEALERGMEDTREQFERAMSNVREDVERAMDQLREMQERTIRSSEDRLRSLDERLEDLEAHMDDVVQRLAGELDDVAASLSDQLDDLAERLDRLAEDPQEEH